MSDVVFRNVTKQFDDVQVIPSLNLAIDSGSFTVLLGPSGLSLIHISEPTRPY